MTDEVWKDFFTDHQTARVMDSSEIWRNFSTAEMQRDSLRERHAAEAALDDETATLDSVEEFRQKVASNPALKERFEKAAEALRDHPELRSKVDPDFLRGLEMLDLGD